MLQLHISIYFTQLIFYTEQSDLKLLAQRPIIYGDLSILFSLSLLNLPIFLFFYHYHRYD